MRRKTQKSAETRRSNSDSRSAAIRSLLLSGLFLAMPAGCKNINTTTIHHIDPVEIGSAWRENGQATQRLESCYREAWRYGYADARQGNDFNPAPKPAAQFEAFHQHLRDESRQQWSAGYRDGYNSAAERRTHQDPHGYHQQLFDLATPNSAEAPISDEAPAWPSSDGQNLAPDRPTPSLEQSNPAREPNTDEHVNPNDQKRSPKYIDEDHVAAEWSTLNSSIRRSVVTNDSQTAQEVPTITVSHPTKSPTTTASITGPLPAVTLPHIDMQETFGVKAATELPTKPQTHTTEAGAVIIISEPAQLHLPSNPNEEEANRESINPPLNLELDLPEFESQPISAASDNSAAAQLASGAATDQQHNNRQVNFDRYSGFSATTASGQASIGIGKPQSPLLTQRQLIRNQLPSRLPLRLRKR